jgi:hypothetical protein
MRGPLGMQLLDPFDDPPSISLESRTSPLLTRSPSFENTDLPLNPAGGRDPASR